MCEADPESPRRSSSPGPGSPLGGWLKLLVGIAVAASVVVPAVFALNFGLGVSGKQETWGQFGDFVGGLLNPYLSLVAFGALIYMIRLQLRSISIQQQELEASREELRLSRIELARGARAQQELVETSQQQLALAKEQAAAESTLRRALNEPRFEIHGSRRTGGKWDATLINRGALASEIRVDSLEPDLPGWSWRGGPVDTNQQFHFDLPQIRSEKLPLVLRLTYRDRLNESHGRGLYWSETGIRIMTRQELAKQLERLMPPE